jgi:predicted nuclease of predicted toxin-antitoxin system
VAQEGLTGRRDPDVWLAAQRSGRFFITQDLDFSDVRQFAPGTHAGLLLVRLAKPGRLALAQRIVQVFGSADAYSWSGCFVVATDVKLRVHRPVKP